MKHTLLFIICFLTTTLIVAQPVNRDSTRAQGMRYMQKFLLLTDSQVRAITDLTIQEEKKNEAMNKASLSPEVRKIQMENNYSDYMKAIKKILNKDQWDQYVVFRESRRNQLVEDAKKKKIKVELGKIKD